MQTASAYLLPQLDLPAQQPDFLGASSLTAPAGLPRTRRLGDRVGDVVLATLTGLAALLGLGLVAAIVWRVIAGAWPAIRVFHAGFLWHNTWNPVVNEFGARDLIIGTLVTSFGAILIAAPLSIAIGLFLSELAPPAVRGPVGTLIEMLAAVPSVVVGLWGIYVLAPFNAQHVQPFISKFLGWIPIFANGEDKIESTVFSAMIVLTIMIIPITSSICRELFLSVPSELATTPFGGSGGGPPPSNDRIASTTRRITSALSTLRPGQS